MLLGFKIGKNQLEFIVDKIKMFSETFKMRFSSTKSGWFGELSTISFSFSPLFHYNAPKKIFLFSLDLLCFPQEIVSPVLCSQEISFCPFKCLFCVCVAHKSNCNCKLENLLNSDKAKLFCLYFSHESWIPFHVGLRTQKEKGCS